MHLSLLVGLAQTRKNATAAVPVPAPAPALTPRTHAAVLGAFVLLTLVLTWPLVLHLSDGVVDGIDPWQSVWNFWAVAGRLGTGQSPFYTDLLYYPQGAALYLHTLFPAVAIPLAPLVGLFGPVVAYNLAQLLAFVLTGYTMYLLCRDLGAGHLGAFLGGLGLDFSAWHTVRLHGHLNLAALYWMPLYLLALFRLERPARHLRQRLAWIGATGLFLALAALCDYQQAVYLGLITLLWLANRMLQRRASGAAPPAPDGKRPAGSSSQSSAGGGKRLALLGRVVVAWAVAGVLLAPVLIGVLAQQAGGDYAHPEAAQVVTFSADLLAYVVPFQYNTFVGSLVTPLVQTLWGKLDTERALYLTATLLVLGLWGLQREWPRSRVWLNVLGVSILLSLGFALHVAGQTSLPLPYLALYLLPGADSVRVPARFGLDALLALAVLASLGFTDLQGRLLRGQPLLAARRRLALLAGSAFVLLGAEVLAVPQPVVSTAVPAFYRQIAARPGALPALLEVPVRDEAIYEYYQTVHGRPLVGGYLSRDKIDPLIEGGPLIRDLKYLDAGDIVQQDPVVAGQALLTRLGIGYVVVHKDPPMATAGYWPWSAADQAAARSLAAAAGRQVYDDAHLTAYAVAPPPPSRPPAIALGAGWQPVITDTVRGRGRWATAGAAIEVDSPGPVTATLQLTMTGYPAHRSVSLLASGAVLAQWDVGSGSPPAAYAGPAFHLSVGVTHLILQSQAPPGLLPALSPLDHYRTPAMIFVTGIRLVSIPSAGAP